MRLADVLFLDANVLFTAAHNPNGKAAFLVARGPWHLITCAYAVEEARRNLARKAPKALTSLEQLQTRFHLVAQPSACRIPLDLPEKDQPIWAAALAAGATHLLTGDLKDFGVHMNRPKQTAGVVIQTVAEYLASL